MSTLREAPLNENWDVEMSAHDYERYRKLMMDLKYGNNKGAGYDLVKIRSRLLKNEFFKQLATLNLLEAKFDLDIPWLGTGRGV